MPNNLFRLISFSSVHFHVRNADDKVSTKNKIFFFPRISLKRFAIFDLTFDVRDVAIVLSVKLDGSETSVQRWALCRGEQDFSGELFSIFRASLERRFVFRAICVGFPSIVNWCDGFKRS